jgi:hypothetical protein
MRDRIALGVAPDGSADVSLIDNETSVPVRLSTCATFWSFRRRSRAKRGW